MDGPSIACIIMAAGASTRFGGDKLAAEIGGRSLLRRACEAVPAGRFSRVCLVTARAEGAALAREFGFLRVPNDRPELGASLTVRLGLEAALPCEASLFLASDQPLLRRASVERLLDAWLCDREKIAALSHEGVRGNPVIFPKRYFPELLALSGDKGGSAVIRRHPGELVTVEAEACELEDIDFAEDLRRLGG